MNHELIVEYDLSSNLETNIYYIYISYPILDKHLMDIYCSFAMICKSEIDICVH